MNPAEYARMRALEDWYWWFVARRKAALTFLDEYAPPATRSAGTPPMMVLDAGCGTGALLEALEARPATRAVGLDFSEEALRFCRERGYPRLVRGDAVAMPFATDRFDAATALDVIEHIPDDTGAAREIFRVLKPGGLLIATVPAYRFLWSGHDVALHHQRRYQLPEFVTLLEGAGLEVVKSTYLISALFPAAVIQRLLSRRRRKESEAAGLPPVTPWLNRALIRTQAVELAAARRVSLPWGLTILVAARKPLIGSVEGGG